MVFEAIGLQVITDPVETNRYRAMPMVRCAFESTCSAYWGHLMPLSGGWKWIVNRNDNELKAWSAEGVEDTPKAAQAAMTDALCKLSHNPNAAWN